MNKLKGYLNKQKGITLIALVITIIVLLILAGISIATLTGNNGILQRATDASNKTKDAEEIERIKLAYTSATINKIGDKVTSGDLQNELDESVGKNQTIVSGTNRLKIRFIYTGNEYTILEGGTVEKYKKADPTNVYATVCSNGDLVFSNNEEDINKYINDNHLSFAEGYTIENITNKQYDGTEIYDESIDETIENYPTWRGQYEPDITKALILNEIAPISTAYWFDDLQYLEIIEGIENLNTSNVTNMKCMFEQDYSLRELDVSGFDTSSCTDMSYMFRLYDSDSYVTVLDISGFDTSNVISMEGMFMGLCSVSNLDVSNFNTSKVTNMYCMFEGCRSIEKLDLRSFDTSNVVSMGGMFENCSSIENLDLSSFNTSNVTNMRWMFNYCNKLKTVYVGNKWNTDSVVESGGMFYNCLLIEGENGTRYRDDAGLSYAHVDGGTSNPGYFSSKHN